MSVDADQELVELTPVAVNSTVYTVVVNNTKYEYTSDASATVAEIIAGLQTLVNAHADVAAVDNASTTLDVTAAATTKVNISFGANITA
jgi:hypothetical protein